MKLLLDTDIGSDIDDAVALAYLLAQPDCELLGVTTCTGDTQRRAALAAAVCDAAGRGGVPIHAGASGPLWGGPGQPGVPQYEAIAARPHRTGFPADAVGFLRDTIRAHPGEVTLLAIGPLTNVALLLRIDPEVPAMLRSLVLMNGVFTGFTARHPRHPRHSGRPGGREWNARCDPTATAIVYDAAPLTTYGLDVTTRCVLDADDARARFRAGTAGLRLVAALAEVWFRDRAEVTFHDPLAAAAVFEPDLCRYVAGRVRVENRSEPLAGLTGLTPEDGGPHRVAVEVDADRFLRHFFGVAGGGVAGGA